MKVTWNKTSKKRSSGALSKYPNLPFEPEDQEINQELEQHSGDDDERELKKNQNHRSSEDGNEGRFDSDSKTLANSFQAQGNKLAEDGKYREALGKWEAALNLVPENAVLHEQKAQLLLEMGNSWNALKAAARATELEPSWGEAWITLGRAQLNFGEPDAAIESFDRALAIKPGSEEAIEDRKTASQLVKRRKQLHTSGLSADNNRYMVGEKDQDLKDQN